eukprot:3720903-Lingulodinium_polyedra.AAC.1
MVSFVQLDVEVPQVVHAPLLTQLMHHHFFGDYSGFHVPELLSLAAVSSPGPRSLARSGASLA